ncbi:O-acetylhomoserine aminocarboxypropyltransferase/cysteine synthase family protein [Leifsonia sp. TF02-11]|uniref:O-acetylhomoserine aminocarboxypropyltransferase/cysteine synthase family protein n=1 Tax=Leifsonia sp. TF02-11 TaxID=2815212 RepID=UPI001AA17702|nr:PLP-dependent transferase [Leifsonia sp. TF02-11]MBO1738551.1 O-acetylhomoserine aminocarboxypropyltransferase/cysteine synthase [Leifsonia sp. TF02-11]
MADDCSRPLDFETRQIHAGSVVDTETRARVTPIYQTAGYVFDDFDDGEERFAGRSRYRAYSRNDNPTNAVAGRRIADLEGGVDGIVVSSGQAAIAAAINALAESGDHILATRSLYEGTREMFRGILKRQGIAFEYVDDDATEDDWARRIRPNTKAVYTETLPNPLNQVVDIARLAGIAHAAGVPLVVDNTVPTPYLWRPIEDGADIVVHSTSKWLSGHGSVIGGAVVDAGRFDWAAHAERFPQLTESPRPGAPSFVERFGAGALLAYLRAVIVLEYGPTVPPLSTFLLLHGIETLSVRMDRHVQNAQAVAAWLEGRAEVARVHYAGLEGDPYHGLASRYLPRGAGSIVSIDLVGGREAARRFLDALELISPMTHIGDVRTLAIHLGSTIHAKLTEAERLDAGITPGLIRLSIGLESPRDLMADLERGLSAAAG